MSQTRYFLFRTAQSLFMVWFVLTFLFFFFRLMPGSYLDIMMHHAANPESVETFKKSWGLDDPLYLQYWRYLANFLTLDVGTSLKYRRPVFEFVQMKIFNSFILIAPAITFSYVVGSFIGVILGTSRGSFLERHGTLPLIFFGSFPSFFIAILLIIVFAGWFNIFPTSGMFSPEAVRQFNDAPWWRPYLSKSFAFHYILPFTAVVMRYLYLPSLIMRTNIVEVLGQDFMDYHKLTGIPKNKRLQHITKHASLPVITLYPVSMTRAIGGLVLVEVVFNWPGIGFTLVDAVLARDFPMVQFVFFLVAVFVIFANYFVDIFYGFIDPRISVSG